MRNDQDRSDRPAGRRSRRGRPDLESLERRALLTLDFSAGYEILGAGVTIGGVSNDSKGDTYVDGSFGGDANFGKDASGKVYQETDPVEFGSEAFVVQYSPTGVVDWLTLFQPQSSIAKSQSLADSIGVDTASNLVYIAGTFAGQVNFDSSGSGDDETSSDSGAGTDGYIIDLSTSTGQETERFFDDFAQTGPDLTVFPRDLTVDSSADAVYLGGDYGGGPLTVTSSTGTPSFKLASTTVYPGFEGFILKFNKDLAIEWAANATDPLGSTYDNGDLQFRQLHRHDLGGRVQDQRDGPGHDHGTGRGGRTGDCTDRDRALSPRGVLVRPRGYSRTGRGSIGIGAEPSIVAAPEVAG